MPETLHQVRAGRNWLEVKEHVNFILRNIQERITNLEEAAPEEEVDLPGATSLTEFHQIGAREIDPKLIPWERYKHPIEDTEVIRLRDEESDTPVSIRRFDDSLHPTLELIRSRGERPFPVAVLSGDVLGDIDWGGQINTTQTLDEPIGARLRAVAADDFTLSIFTEDEEKIGGDTVNSSWTANANRPLVRTITVDGNSTVFAGPSKGDTSGGGAAGEFWSYDITGGSWTDISPWVADPEVIGFAIISTSTRILYLGVGSDSTGADVWAYDIDADSWTQIGDDSANDPNFAEAVAFSGYLDDTNQILYVGTETATAAVWEYDIDADTWTKIGEAPGDFPNISGFSADGIRGIARHDDTGDLYVNVRYFSSPNGAGHLFRYNGSTWSQIADPVSHDSFEGIAIRGDYVYVCTQDISTGGEIWEWDIDGASWTQIGGNGAQASYTGPRSRQMFLLNDELYTSIQNDSGEGEVWKYTFGAVNPAAGSWELLYTAPSEYDAIENFGVDSDNVIYAGMGYNSGDGDVYKIGSVTGENLPTALELYVSQTNTLLLSTKWYDKLDIFLGYHAGAFDGIYWDESTARVGILTTTPEYTLNAVGIIGSTGPAARLLFRDQAEGATDNWSFYSTSNIARITEENLGADIMRWHNNGDVDISGDGVFWDESTQRLGLLTTTPARTLHVAGTDGIRVAPAALPGSPAVGDLAWDSADENWPKFYNAADAAWKEPVAGPAAAVASGNIAVWNGTTGKRIQDGGAVPNDALDWAWEPTTDGDSDHPELIFDGGEVVVDAVYIG